MSTGLMRQSCREGSWRNIDVSSWQYPASGDSVRFWVLTSTGLTRQLGNSLHVENGLPKSGYFMVFMALWYSRDVGNREGEVFRKCCLGKYVNEITITKRLFTDFLNWLIMSTDKIISLYNLDLVIFLSKNFNFQWMAHFVWHKLSHSNRNVSLRAAAKGNQKPHFSNELNKVFFPRWTRFAKVLLSILENNVRKHPTTKKPINLLWWNRCT